MEPKHQYVLETITHQLTDQLTALSADYFQLSNEKSVLEQKVSELAERCRNAEKKVSDNGSLCSELSNLKAYYSAALDENSQLTDAVNKLEGEKAQLYKENSLIQREYQKLVLSHTAQKVNILDLGKVNEALTAEVESLRAENERLESIVAVTPDARDLINALKDSVKTLTAQRDNAKRLADSYADALDKVRNAVTWAVNSAPAPDER